MNRGRALGNPASRRHHPKLWLSGVTAAAAVIAAAVIAVLTLTPASAVGSSGGATINTKMAACEGHQRICDPAAFLKLPFTGPAPAGTALLTQRELVAKFGLSGGRIAAERTTYGQLHAADPALAASDAVYAGRLVWVVTRYFAPAVVVVDPAAPLGAPETHKISAESFVIDAATGQVIDYCQGCAVVGDGLSR